MRFQEILETNFQKWKDRDYIFEKKDGVYHATTYGDFLNKSHILAEYLLRKGLLGKSVMLYGNNSSKLMMADLAVLEYVGVSVWVSKEWLEPDIDAAVELLDIACIIYGEEKRECVEAVAGKHPELLCISTLEFDEIFQQGKYSLLPCKPRDWEECCKIVFSSGTTAAPKAVMLSKKNIFAGLEPLYQRCPFHEGDVDYLFLPLSHTYGGIYNFLYSLVFGFSIYLCSDIAGMAQEILEVNPTLFCGVPAIYRRFYEGYGSNIGKAFGNRIQYLFCGGANFDQEIRKAYKESGLNMMEAYALSETASTFAIQYPNDSDVECAGTVAENLDVKITESGEIVVKGDNVFLGYAKRPELTKASFTEDGYFKTGDLGYLKPDEVHGGQKLYITGRCKKQLIGENGEIVEPEHIEVLICRENANINKALLYVKDGRIGCHVYVKESEDRNWDVFFERINSKLPGYERIRFYDVIVDSVEKRLKQ